MPIVGELSLKSRGDSQHGELSLELSLMARLSCIMLVSSPHEATPRALARVLRTSSPWNRPWSSSSRRPRPSWGHCCGPEIIRVNPSRNHYCLLSFHLEQPSLLLRAGRADLPRGPPAAPARAGATAAEDVASPPPDAGPAPVEPVERRPAAAPRLHLAGPVEENHADTEAEEHGGGVSEGLHLTRLVDCWLVAAAVRKGVNVDGSSGGLN